MTDKEELRNQIADQCKVVAALAGIMQKIHIGDERLIRSGHADELLNIIGSRTAQFMEDLGDMVNAIDANSPNDDWMNPIFNKAHKLHPFSVTPPKQQGGE